MCDGENAVTRDGEYVVVVSEKLFCQLGKEQNIVRAVK